MKNRFSCQGLLSDGAGVAADSADIRVQEKHRTWSCQTNARGIVVALGLTLTLLAGCVSNPGSPNAPSGLADADRINTPERERAQIRLALASSYFENGQYEVALDEAGRALDVDPRFSDAYTLRGLAYSKLGEHARAEASFRRALEIRPNDVDARHNLGMFYCQSNQLAQAVTEFQQAVAHARSRERLKTLMAMGICQARLGDLAGAEQSLQQAQALDASEPLVAYNLGLLRYRRGAYEGALAAVRPLNNSQYANAESMWLGIRAARKAGDGRTMRDLAEQLRRRFATSKEYRLFQQGVFDD